LLRVLACEKVRKPVDAPFETKIGLLKGSIVYGLIVGAKKEIFGRIGFIEGHGQLTWPAGSDVRIV